MSLSAIRRFQHKQESPNDYSTDRTLANCRLATVTKAFGDSDFSGKARLQYATGRNLIIAAFAWQKKKRTRAPSMNQSITISIANNNGKQTVHQSMP